MPQKKTSDSAQDPTLQLKTLALRDDRLVHNYRDIHYQLIIDSLQASGQRIASRERVAPLSDTRYKRLMKQYASLRERICKKYKISGFYGGDPYIVKKDGWLATIQVSLNKRLMVETNWQTSFFAPAIQFHVIPENAKVYPSESGTIYQLPDLPKRPQTSPCMTIHLDLSQVKPNALAPLTEEFKEAVKQCLAELPLSHRKPPSAWEQNVDRDYRRFRQHFYQGVPYRWIAAYERVGVMPKRKLNVQVPQESSVRDSVERVHSILFGKKLATGRKSASRLSATLSQFNCPEHPRDCPNSCPYALNFIKNLQQIR